MKHGGKRPGAGMPQGTKKAKLKPPAQLRKTKGIRYTQEEQELIDEAVRRYVVEKSVEAAKKDIADATEQRGAVSA